MPAGGVVFHNGFIAHGAGANMTQGRRRALTIVYVVDGATFDRSAARAWVGAWAWTSAQHARYGPGDRLDDDEQFPLVVARAAGPAPR